MIAQGGGWFEVEAETEPGDAYTYRLKSGRTVPDPASRAQADDVHDPSLVVDANAYCWRHPEWRGRPWHEAILYEVHPGIYGGFAGVQSDLDRLADLGITAVELMPIGDFAGKRNWGYDGVLPFAPDRVYGTPDELRALVDAAHERRLMMFLDVVYNHFGPDGNYLGLYAPQFFREDIKTPWGAAIDFRQPAVRRFFIENALYWLTEFRFDGLRFDAVHAIADPTFLDEMAAEIRASIGKERHVHLVLEHDGNEARHLRGGFDAQWNDDAHHALHVLLTGEHDGYYKDFAVTPAAQLARCLAEGFAYQGDSSIHRKGQPRGSRSADLSPTAFVLFLQNHDQIGNRAFGERLTELAHPDALRAAVTLQLLAPQIPLLFMGEERMSRVPFQFFTDFHGTLATAVREGRQREFASFGRFVGDIPDPNAVETFERSRVPANGDDSFHRALLALRHATILPRLAGTRSIEARAIGAAAVTARWQMGDGAELTIGINLGEAACDFAAPEAAMLFVSRVGALDGGRLGGHSAVAFLGQSA